MDIDKVGIIGLGIIGSAVNKLFKNSVIRRVYDVKGNYSIEDKEKVSECDIAFVCVPTPHNKCEGLDMSIIESVISDFNCKMFIICSALQPGTADRLSKKYNKKIVVQPEYFGETISHPLVDMADQNFLILGGESEDVDIAISLYQKVYNANVRIRKVTALEAEVIKLSENRAIAYKVSQCQELYDVCKAAGVDYNVIREAVYGDDPRFNLWWTFIYENARGCNSKCIPKDVYGWSAWATSVNCPSNLTNALLKYNSNLLFSNNIKEI
jgi:UDPglucose 6-dehydrogenase